MPRKKNPVNPAPVNPPPPAPELVAASTLANEASGLLNRLQTALGDMVSTVARPFSDAPKDEDDRRDDRRRNPPAATHDDAGKSRLHVAAADETGPDAGNWIEDSCPVCKTDLIVAVGVVQVRCPNCSTLLDIEEPADESDTDAADEDVDEYDDADETPAPKADKRRKNPGFFGAFSRRKG